MTPELSIIVINKGDRRIRDTLQAIVPLCSAEPGRIEVIVVDGSEHRLDEIASEFPQVRWIPFAPVPGRVTIAHQRNVGVDLAQGQTIVFTDAACIPGDDWLEKLSAPIRSGVETVVAGSHRSPTGNSLRDEDISRIQGQEYLREAPTINLALDRAVFDEIGKFDERFDYGSDVDLSWRLVDAGHRIRYVPEAEVVHDWGPTSEQLRRTWVYGRARARLFLKHRSRWRNLLGEDLPLIAYPAYLVACSIMLKRPRMHLLLLIPLYRNRGHRPVLAVVGHLIRGAAAIWELISRLAACVA